MSSLERLLGPNCNEGPECRCGDDASVNHSECRGGGKRKVKNATRPKRTPIIDHHYDTSTAYRISYSSACPEGQGAMRCRKATWVELPSASDQAVMRVI